MVRGEMSFEMWKSRIVHAKSFMGYGGNSWNHEINEFFEGTSMTEYIEPSSEAKFRPMIT